MDHLQTDHYELLFEQHQLNLVACCVYAVTRVVNVSVPFKRVTEAVQAAFPLASPTLFQEAVVTDSTVAEGAGLLHRFGAAHHICAAAG